MRTSQMTKNTDFRSTVFLRSHMRSIAEFYLPACIDETFGGYHNQMLDDGTIYDASTKHLVGTCRFIYNFSLCALELGDEKFRQAAAHGLEFLQKYHRQADGGYAWVLNQQAVSDGTYHCYGHAFVLLAAAGAQKAGLYGAEDVLEQIWEVLEKQFWDPRHRLYVDEISAGVISPYRGQNANMHLCEAMLAAYEATRDDKFIARAAVLAKRICRDLAESTDGLIWEHYKQDWAHDWEYNKGDPQNLFRPYGYLPGHFTEWSKLLLILNRYADEEWSLSTAEHLFQAAMSRAYDSDTGKINYSFAPNGEILDSDQYYWVFSESLAAAALLADVTGQQTYWQWYERLWLFADAHFIDHTHGGWYRILDKNCQKYSNEKSPPSKTDYHPLAACFEILQSRRLGEPSS